ncbi:MAG: rhodanese-related sulfurtransferase [Opitutales bacterium]
MSETVNLSCYKFVRLEGLVELKARLLSACVAHGLKGTVLLAPEGINFFLAGGRDGLGAVLGLLRAQPGLEDLVPKESPSAEQPFRRMLVKIKREIIAFGVPGVDPAADPAPRLRAPELRRWFEEGREFTLLDTRNVYEVRMGTFRGALDPRIWNFRDFPRALAALPDSVKDRPVVTFCTGGIRCEKAAPLLRRHGFKDVYQLDGGILRYFEEVGGAHYDGECFVFDARVGVGPDLRPTGSLLCHNCQMPLTAEEAKLPSYVPDRSCLHCVAGKPTGRGNTVRRPSGTEGL